MLLLLLVGGEYVSGLQLSQQLYKLLLWSFVLRALSGYIRCIYFGVTAGSLCYASDLSSQTCVLLLSPILVGAVFGFFFLSKSLFRLQYTTGLQTMGLHLMLLFYFMKDCTM